MTTGKNKENFEKWFRLNFHWTIEDAGDGTYFNALPFEMQIGVYLAYYDSVGYRIGIDCYYDMQGTYRTDFVDKYHKVHGFQSKDMKTAYKEAFKKADELINQK